MAVHCGVCAERLSDAMENYGSFRGTKDLDGVDPGKIHDTCERCDGALRIAVTKAANAISKKHRVRVDALRAEIQGFRDREEANRKKESDFRRDWEQKRRTGA